MTGRSVMALIVAAALSLGACSSPATQDGEAPFQVPGSPERTTQVSLPKSYRFDPAVIEIAAGDTVTWTNNDNFPHNVHLLDGSDRSVDLPIGENGSLTFEEPGTLYYECSIHPQQMHGKIIVE